VASWNVGYIVLTSVDRDDLPDGGASHFARTVQLIKAKKPSMLVECLTPDFQGDLTAVQMLARSGLDVYAHNIETVESLQVCISAIAPAMTACYITFCRDTAKNGAKRRWCCATEPVWQCTPPSHLARVAGDGGAHRGPRQPPKSCARNAAQRRVRDARASYAQSLAVLRAAKEAGVYTKSSVMLGLGEREHEVAATMQDLRGAGVDIVTLGQYLQPTARHLAVERFVPPEDFERWRRYGQDTLGFRSVASSLPVSEGRAPCCVAVRPKADDSRVVCVATSVRVLQQ
jgi:lipoate synthase